MLLQASKIIGLAVAAIDIQKRVGKVVDVVVEPNNGQILGFVVATGLFFLQNKVLSAIDVREFDKNGLVTTREDNIIDGREIVRINQILQQKIKILGAKAQNESGDNLGIVYDFVFDSEVPSILKYYIKDIWQEKILPSEKVIKIKKGLIVFSDDALQEVGIAEPEEAAA